MKLHHRRYLPLLGIILLALTSSACGKKGSEELEGVLECGPGTVLSGEQCIIADFDCSEGQVPLPAGGCAEPSVYCGDSTSYDVELERCIAPERIECGEGTVAVDDRCLVMDAMTCGEGTVLADGECRLSAAVCGNGTALNELQCEPTDRACGPMTDYDVVLERCVFLGTVECGEDTIEDTNRCVPLRTFVDELAQEATVDYGNAPANPALNPGSEVGDRVVFKGAMTGATGLFHVYSLTAVPGQWLKVTLYPQGIPSVGFRARTIFTDWERKVPAGQAAIASRYLIPISSDQHDLIIESSLSGTGLSAGIADSSWTYVGVVEVVDPPSSTVWADPETVLAGDMHDRESSLIEVPIQEDNTLLITPQSIGADVEKPVVEIWESPTTFTKSMKLQVGEPFIVNGAQGQSSVFLRFDAMTLHGPRADFSVLAQRPFTLSGGLAMENEIEARAGQMLFFAQESTAAGPVAVQILKGDDVLYVQDVLLARNKSGNFGSKESDRGFFYIPEDGTYTVRFENTGVDNYDDFFPSLAVQDVPTFRVSAQDTVTFETLLEGQDLRPGQWRFVVIQLEDGALIEGTTATSKGSPQLSILNDQNEELLAYTSSSSFGFDVYTSGTLLLAYRPTSTVTLVSDIEVNLSAAPNELLPPQEIYQQTFDAEVFDILSGTITYRNGGAPTIRFKNPDDMIVFEKTMTSKTMDIFELIPGDGEFVLEVINRSEEPTVDLEVDLQIITPIAEYNFGEPTAEQVTIAEPLEKGEQKLILMRSTEELKHTIVAAAGSDDEDERIALRLLDLNTLKLLDAAVTMTDPEVRLNLAQLPPGLYLLEIVAVTDLDQGFELDWTVAIPTLRTVAGEPITIPISSSTQEMDFYTDQVTVENCNRVDTIEIEIKKGSGLYNHDLQFTLISPNEDEVILLEYADQGNTTLSRTFSYPSPDTPKEPLDPFIGKNGAGVWTLEVGYQWTNAGRIDGWSLTLDCS